MELADRLRQALTSHDEVVAAWLFGSRARDRSSARSDADVAILFRDEPPSTTASLAADLTSTVGMPVDVVVVNRANPELVHRALRDGALVCDRDPSRRIAFEVQKRAEYFDLTPVWHQYRRAPDRA